MQSEESYFGIEDDPVLGKFIANYPGDRLRLLLIGGAIMAAVWFVVTVLLWQVEAGQAATITVVVLAITMLLVGWYIAHLWNREVVLFEKGFSYREGSTIAFIHYADVMAIQQRAERLSYFGGLLRRTVFQVTLLTSEDERISMTNFYRRIDELSLRLEQLVTQAQGVWAREALAAGGRLNFTSSLSANSSGLSEGGREIAWAALGEYRIQNRQLSLLTRDGETWYSASLSSFQNIRLLLDLLRERLATRDASS